MITISEHKIIDTVGIHARPAGKLATLLKAYKSKVMLNFGEKQTDAKSLLALMKTGIKCGDVVSFVIEGEDERIVHAVLVAFLETNL
jgi:phosphotransferase system HPr (HPr) family protein